MMLFPKDWEWLFQSITTTSCFKLHSGMTINLACYGRAPHFMGRVNNSTRFSSDAPGLLPQTSSFAVAS